MRNAIPNGTPVVFTAPYCNARPGVVKESFTAGGFVGYVITDAFRTDWRLGGHNVSRVAE